MHIAARVDAQTLLETPETVLQQMSLKIMERREEVIAQLIGSRVAYQTSDGVRYGRIERIDNQKTVVISEGTTKVRVSFKRLEV